MDSEKLRAAEQVLNANADFEMAISVDLWIALCTSGKIERQRMNRHRTIHHPESFVAPTGFALEGLRYAKRVYEKTASGRARDARQELHNAERPAAPQR